MHSTLRLAGCGQTLRGYGAMDRVWTTEGASLGDCSVAQPPCTAIRRSHFGVSTSTLMSCSPTVAPTVPLASGRSLCATASRTA